MTLKKSLYGVNKRKALLCLGTLYGAISSASSRVMCNVSHPSGHQTSKRSQLVGELIHDIMLGGF